MQDKRFILTAKRSRSNIYIYLQHSRSVKGKTRTESHYLGPVTKINEIFDDLMANSETLFIGDTILHALFTKLHINSMFDKQLRRWGALLAEIRATHCMIGLRAIRPFSKLRLTRQLKHSFSKYDFPVQNVNQFYKAMDLIKQPQELFRKCVKKVFAELDYTYDTSYFDTTTVFFFSDVDDFRRKAYGNGGKRGAPRIRLAVSCTEDYLPTEYSVYRGNASDVTILREYIPDHDLEKLLVFDAGCYSIENIRAIEGKDRKIDYVCSTDISKYTLTTETREVELHDQKWVIREGEHKAKNDDGEVETRRIIEAYNIDNHERGLEKLDRKIKRVVDLAKTVTGKEVQDKRDKVYDLASSLSLKTLLKINIDGDSITVNKDDRMYKKRQGMTKRILLMTSLKKEAEDCLDIYLHRTDVEKCFDYLKNPLALRPIYHRAEPRIRSHAFIVMMGYLQLTALRIYLRQKWNVDLTLEMIIEEMSCAAVTTIEPREGVKITYLGKQEHWIETLCRDLEIPVRAEDPHTEKRRLLRAER